jgi:DNA mismatch endonuclease (patch repair protein)
VIFVHGCFWHGHDCARGARIPKANRDYWQSKIGRNVTRDAAHLTALQAAGWRAAVIWECELRQPGLVRRRLAVFLRVRAGAQRGRPS